VTAEGAEAGPAATEPIAPDDPTTDGHDGRPAVPSQGSPFAPLRHRSFALLWSGAFVSNIGNWMEAIAVGSLIADSTGKSSWTGLVIAADFLPQGLLGPIGGALADRKNRRRLIVSATVAQAAFATALAVLVAHDSSPSPGLVALLVFGLGCAGAVGFPAYQAILPDLVPREELLAATALSQAQFNLGRVIGPALAGLVITLAGYQWAFAVDAISFFAVVAAVMTLRLPAVTGAATSIRRTLGDGFRYAWRERGVRAALLTIMTYALLASPFIGLTAAVSKKVFDAGPRGNAVLVTSQGIGAVCMALATGYLASRFGRRRTLLGVLVCMPVLLVAYALAPELWVAAIAIAFVGMTYLGMLSGLGAVVQLRTPRRLRGRVLSLFFATLGLFYPIGLAVHGWLGDRIGLRTTTAGAACVLLVLGVAWNLRRPQWTAPWDDMIEDG
jgi:MFS family permease